MSAMEKEKSFDLSCPAPITESATVLLAHGGGGSLMHRLIDRVFLPSFKNSWLAAQHDGAVISFGEQKLAFTTDSYVVHPLFFPGGDIGDLAVNGTVNDLAMCGARPLYLSAAFILEEGLPMDQLKRVVESMRKAAQAAGVDLVTGDTKVVDKGKGDGLFINTAGIGIVETPHTISPLSILPGDGILVSGDVGRHGIAIMAVREGLSFETAIESDTAPVAQTVLNLLAAGIRVHCLRDATRGGLAGVLVEIAQASHHDMAIEESAIPVREDVRGACEILGLDPLYVANEGCFAAFVAEADIPRALEILRQDPHGSQASLIGHVGRGTSGLVTMKGAIGVPRILDQLSGEQLPRIC
jgi:hydrogenase expression/formation protein HypE